MLTYVVMTCRLHVCDMFDEIPVMTSRGQVKSLFKIFHYYLCFYAIYHLWKFHEVLGSDLILGPEKVALDLGSLAHNSLKKATVTWMPCCGSD